jgi:hypothetical protein
MYDKYSQANPITIGAKIPKHKGILLTGAFGLGSNGVTMTFVNNSGTTFNTVLTFVANTTNIVPMQAYAIPTALPTGCTAFYLN